MSDAHGVTSETRVTADGAEHIARVMGALATASRVRILARLREGPCTVGELMLAVEMAQPAVSHQLRILRDLGLVFGRRTGRHTTYALYDSHVATLLDETLRHIEHLRAGVPEPPLATLAHTNTTGVLTMTDDAHTHVHEAGLEEIHEHRH